MAGGAVGDVDEEETAEEVETAAGGQGLVVGVGDDEGDRVFDGLPLEESG